MTDFSLSPRLPLKAFFRLNELIREVEIGCADDEHNIKQRVLISIEVELQGEAVFCGDTMNPPYDYCDIISAVDQAIESRPRFILQETLLFMIAKIILMNPIVKIADISFSKIERYPACQSIGVRATFNKDDILSFSNHYPDF